MEHAAPHPLLELRNFSVRLPWDADRRFAVEDVSMSLSQGEILCVVGESGSGKSITAQAIIGLLPKELPRPDGEILLQGESLTSASPNRMRSLRGRNIGMIFQEPMTSLNPMHSIGRQIEEVLRTHVSVPAAERFKRVTAIMREVGLPDPERLYDAFPHQLSGGQRQRVLIAAAMILKPQLLIADEPTTALDVTTQAQILKQIKELRSRYGVGVLFITHDFGVVAEMGDKVAVMKDGRLVEIGPTSQILNSPRQEYTRTLINAVPGVPVFRRPVPLQNSPALRAVNLSKTYTSKRAFRPARAVQALSDTSLSIHRGETLGVIGESGSGKSTLARCITRLIEPTTGAVELAAERRSDSPMPFRKAIQIVFQDPSRSLNPRRSVGSSIVEGPMNFGMSRRAAWERASALMDLVGLDANGLTRFPHQFSGGQRQRICIARALAMEPEVLIADEAVSALDVSVQAQILDLLTKVQKAFDLAMLFITHDLRVAAQLCDRLLVMHRGMVVEQGATQEIFLRPKHAYTQQLLSSVPGRAIGAAERESAYGAQAGLSSRR
ncbi:MAG: ABC transporter ATP-binding protein [Microvirga sp.]